MSAEEENYEAANFKFAEIFAEPTGFLHKTDRLLFWFAQHNKVKKEEYKRSKNVLEGILAEQQTAVRSQAIKGMLNDLQKKMKHLKHTTQCEWCLRKRLCNNLIGRPATSTVRQKVSKRVENVVHPNIQPALDASIVEEKIQNENSIQNLNLCLKIGKIVLPKF